MNDAVGSPSDDVDVLRCTNIGRARLLPLSRRTPDQAVYLPSVLIELLFITAIPLHRADAQGHCASVWRREWETGVTLNRQADIAF